MVWNINDPQCNESRKIVWEVAPYLRGRGLDIGAGDFKIIPHAISVDDMDHAKFGFTIKPDIVADASDLSMFAGHSMDYVYSSHTLEHIENAKSALHGWWRLVKPGGYLILYLPHKNFYPNIGQPGANPDHKHDFLPQDVIDMVPHSADGWDLVEMQERNEGREYSFLLVFKKLRSSGVRKYSHTKPKPEKTACVVRYGAYGDVLQASSVFRGLKKQGYHVTVFASPPGSDVIKYDPNIDNLVLFDKDQVPNGDLSSFWEWQAKKFDKFVNLSESVEGTLLALPGRVQHGWSPVLRHKMLDKNYMEHQHDIAGIPYEPCVRFYATDDEVKVAKKRAAKMGGPIVLWVLNGSSVHKTWQGLDSMIAAIMLNYPTTTVILAGGPEGVLLEQGWENEPRVVRTSGKWSIRETMAMAQVSNLVIGPETGVLNAVSNEPVDKIVFLSHSSVNNLTRDWVNTKSVWSRSTRCRLRPEGVPACHMMHYGWGVCIKDENTGTALCQADIDDQEVWDAIAAVLDNCLE